MRKCPCCNSTDLEPGKVQSTGQLYFKPSNTKFLTWKTGNVKLEANICLTCGFVMLVGDTAKTKELTSRNEPS